MARVLLLLLHLPSAFVLWDALRLPQAAWRASGVPRPAWVAIQVVLGAIGAVVYVMVVRPQVVAHVPGRSPKPT